MIRQLRRLTRPLPAAGPTALALAVYAEVRDGAHELRAARERGFEGVACLDDAARAAVLYSVAWRRHRLTWAAEAARGLLRFVGYLQLEDGRFANFIVDWDGRPNLIGPTSQPGGWAWTARAMHALAVGLATFEEDEYAERFERGLPWLDLPCPYLDVRAVCVLAVLEHWQATGASASRQRALTWCEVIAASRSGDRLPDASGQSNVHLWGHLQEAALARVGRAFDRPDLVEVARKSVEAIFVPAVERSFATPTSLPFEVSCAVAALSAVAEATDQPRYAELAQLARDWFAGRNAAGKPVYDRLRGLVHDGIDDGVLNESSGAESNIEGALALFDSLPWTEYGS